MMEGKRRIAGEMVLSKKEGTGRCGAQRKGCPQWDVGSRIWSRAQAGRQVDRCGGRA
jgi:hypothetical protein